jgi:hypothetical protein
VVRLSTLLLLQRKSSPATCWWLLVVNFVVAERWRVPAPTVVQNTECAVVVVVVVVVCANSCYSRALALCRQLGTRSSPPSSLLPLLALALRCNKFGHLGTCADAMADDDPPITRVASCTGAGAVGGSSTSPSAAPAATSPSACVKRLDGPPSRSLVSVELGGAAQQKDDATEPYEVAAVPTVHLGAFVAHCVE